MTNRTQLDHDDDTSQRGSVPGHRGVEPTSAIALARVGERGHGRAHH